MYIHIYFWNIELRCKSKRWINTVTLSAPALRAANSLSRVEGQMLEFPQPGEEIVQ